MEEKGQHDAKTVRVVFLSLLLDLLAFTMILPLFPALLEHYEKSDDGTGLYSVIMARIKTLNNFLNAPEKVGTVLYGGFLGSMYSFLQFISAPTVGALSDTYGRKPLLVLSLIGIAVSHLVWIFSYNFGLFIIARMIGGISKGNVSLSMAIVTDVTGTKSRGKGMAMIGIAFSIGFTLGPMIGAYFARMSVGHREDHWYMVPAMLAFLLSTIDIVYVIFCFNESLPKKYRTKSFAQSFSDALTYINPFDLFQFNGVRNLNKEDLHRLRILGYSFFLYLFVYSGLEFTLTFLTHYSYNFTRMQQGWMFLAIGLIMTVLQGSWVRNIPAHRTKFVTLLGLWLIIPAFIFIGIAKNLTLLFLGIFLFAVSTSMVVTCMNTLVSRIGDDTQKGVITGIFRSLGMLARACGPVTACIVFWSLGSSTSYLIGAGALVLPPLILQSIELS